MAIYDTALGGCWSMLSKINTHIFSFGNISLKESIFAPTNKIIYNRAMAILFILEKANNYRIIRKFNDVSVYMVATTIICIQDVQERGKDAALGRAGGCGQLLLTELCLPSLSGFCL